MSLHMHKVMSPHIHASAQVMSLHTHGSDANCCKLECACIPISSLICETMKRMLIAQNYGAYNILNCSEVKTVSCQ